MKIAIIGSRNAAFLDLAPYIPKDCTEIVSGGAAGVDRYAAAYAKVHGLALTEFLPLYETYGRAAPIIRNKQIAEYADAVIAFWDGASRGTLSVIRYCKKMGKSCQVIEVRGIGDNNPK